MLSVRGLTVSEFARQTGIAQPTMHRIVHGKVDLSGISVDRFLRIAHGLGVSAEQLYYGDSSYDRGKVVIDRVYATSRREGRQAMVANAIGVSHTYPMCDGRILPPLTDDLETLKAP